jgi:hypothetical protein
LVWDVVFNVLFEEDVPELPDDGVAEVAGVVALVPDFVVAAATCVVDPDWSRTAMTPPSARVAATLRTAAALRARAARGLRFPGMAFLAVTRLSSIGRGSCSGAGDQRRDDE